MKEPTKGKQAAEDSQLALDPALLDELSLDETTLDHVSELVEDAEPLHQDCLPCRWLRQAIADHAARVGEHRVDES